MKKVVLKKIAIFTGNHLHWFLFFNKVSGMKACSIIKETSTQVFSSEHCEIFRKDNCEVKNIYERLLLNGL